MWEYVIGGATIFGTIVAIGAWINGRLTRKYLGELILSTQQLIQQESAATRELISSTQQLIEEESRLTREFLAQLIQAEFAAHRQLLDRMDQRLELMRQYLERESKLDPLEQSQL